MKINPTCLFFFWFQLDYKKKYEATKNKWIWTSDRPDFINAAKNSLQQSDVSVFFIIIIILTPNIASLILLLSFFPQVEYKYDKEMMKGCVIPVVDDKLTILAMKNAEMASSVSLSTPFFFLFLPLVLSNEITEGPLVTTNS